VSVLAGLLVDKFVYHLPLYRQHQRLADAGITLSRTTLTSYVQRAIDLVAPIAKASTPTSCRAKSWRWTRRRSRPGGTGRAS